MSSDPGAAGQRDKQAWANRLLPLSDGVIAIALTLLVLQLRVPDVSRLTHPDSAADLADQLGRESAQLISYVISFYVIAQFWLVHRQVFRLVSDQEDGLEWWNFAFLFTITIMPFTSDLLGSFVGNPLAVDIFALNLMIASLATHAMTVIARRRGMVAAAATARAGQTSAMIVPAVMALSIAVSWWSTAAAMYCWILIAVGPAAVNRWVARRDREPGQGDQGEAQTGP